MKTKTKESNDSILLAARELAEKAGVSPAVLRKLLRQEFNRAGTKLIKGNRAK